jgi:phage gp36-like protein
MELQMSYITNNDIQTRVGPAAYVQLADDNGDAGADSAVVDEIRGAAEGEVDSFLAARYATPIDVDLHAELAELLKSVTLDIAEYRLRARRPPMATDIVQRYHRTIEWLGLIAKGVLSLPSLIEVSAPNNRGIVAASIGEPRLLSRDELAAN